MNPVPAAAPKRRLWPWIVAILLSPFVVIGFAAYSFLTLHSEAATLRRHVMAATHTDWNTRIQFSVGRLSFSALRAGLSFIPDLDYDARLALGAVRHASVGIYERGYRFADVSREQLFVETDKAMQRRGWTRLVGAINHKESVLVYVPTDANLEGTLDVCLAVLGDREMVVASASLDGDTLMKLVHTHVGGEFRDKLRHIRL